ncbi:hypothetical protein AAG570_007234 [Ranatra chinensis]|uniref:Uncharacterized protein n=1 Tax=Ranatra chinensis TaxID=642074 RepID=A0ABD0Y8C8_9HEMI
MPGLLLASNERGWPRVGKMTSAGDPKPLRSAEVYREEFVSRLNQIRILRDRRFALYSRQHLKNPVKFLNTMPKEQSSIPREVNGHVANNHLMAGDGQIQAYVL